MSEPEGLYQFTVPVIMTFPNLLTAKAVTRNGKATGEAKYSANFLFKPDSPDLNAIKALAAKLAKAKWPGKPLSELTTPWRDGDKLAEKRKAKKGKDDAAFNRGKIVLIARTKYQPRLSILGASAPIDLDTPELLKLHGGKFYSGVEVLAEVNLVPYDAVEDDGKPGVTAYLQAVLSLNKGDKLTGGGRSAAETFKGYVGHASSEDPTQNETLPKDGW